MNKALCSQLLKKKTVTVPLFFFQNYKKMNLSLEEFFFLMYLKDQGEVFLFDPNEMMSDLGYSMMEIMQLLSSLTDKKMITVDSFKNEHGIMEEKINLSSFYEKYTMLIMEESNQEKEKKNIAKH